MRTARWPSVGCLGFGRGTGRSGIEPAFRAGFATVGSERSFAAAALAAGARCRESASAQSASRQMRKERAIETVTGTQHGHLKRPAASR